MTNKKIINSNKISRNIKIHNFSTPQKFSTLKTNNITTMMMIHTPRIIPNINRTNKNIQIKKAIIKMKYNPHLIKEKLNSHKTTLNTNNMVKKRGNLRA